jgi:glutathione S-transferase
MTIDRDTYFRLYAAEPSYYSAKVRPAFRYKRVPYVEILPTRDVYKHVIQARTGLGMIPVVVTPEDETWQDSSEILDALEARFPDPPLLPTTSVQRVVAHLIELYADEFLIMPGLHYRWSFPESEKKARADFAAFMGDRARTDRFADSIMNFTRMVGVTPETAPAIEAHTRDLLALLEKHFESHQFLLGDRPSLADYGLIGPLYPHLYYDAVPGRLLRETAPRTCHWIERVNHPDPDARGEWLPGDEISPVIVEFLHLIGDDAVPVVLDIVNAFDAGTYERDAELPRITGMHASQLRGVAFERVTTPYTLWMVQRVLDVYAELADRRRVDAALNGSGCDTLLAHRPRHRVARRPFKLYLER